MKLSLGYNTVELRIYKRHSNEQSVQIADLANDMQYMLQTLTGIEDRLANVEEAISRQGKDITLII